MIASPATPPTAAPAIVPVDVELDEDLVVVEAALDCVADTLFEVVCGVSDAEVGVGVEETKLMIVSTDGDASTPSA